MRVAIVTVDFPEPQGVSALGGVGTSTNSLVQGLLRVRPELDVHLIRAPAGKGGASYQIGDPSITVHNIEVGRFLGMTRLPRREIKNLLDSLRPDVVHVEGHASYVDGTKHPAVLRVHGIPERDTLFRHKYSGRLRSWVLARIHRPARERYRHVIATVAYVARTLEHCSSTRFHFIPHAVEDEFFDVRHEEAGPRILYAGHLTPLKNVHGIIEAVAILAEQGVECSLRLAGRKVPGPYLSRLESLIQQRALEDRVVFLGWLDRDELRREGARARCFVLPSFQECSPMSIAECNAMGLPAVVSAAGGSAELITHNYSGMLVDARTPASIAAGIRPFLLDDGLAARFGERARAQTSRSRPEQVARLTLDVFSTVIQEHRSQHRTSSPELPGSKEP